MSRRGNCHGNPVAAIQNVEFKNVTTAVTLSVRYPSLHGSTKCSPLNTGVCRKNIEGAH